MKPEKQSVELEVCEYSWYCPHCQEYNFVKADYAFEDGETEDVKCEDYKKEFYAEIK